MKKFFENPRMKIIVISASAVLVLIITVVMVACFNAGNKANQKDKDADNDAAGAFVGIEDEKPGTSNSGGNIKSSESDKEAKSPEGLAYTSNGDGTCIIVGIGSCTAKELEIPEKSPAGDTVTDISDSAFDGCTSLVSVSIPYTVKSIGTGAFLGCTSLSAFSVESSNTKYCSIGGVLFSKDKTELICYPAERVGRSYLLSTNVKKISDYAFYGASNLKTIMYEGTMTKFQSITVGSGNDAFGAMAVTCNYNPAK